MKFLYPQFLYALIAVIIPVIIHLFNFQRHKRVYFSNVAFLKEVKQSTKAKSNIKHYLILLSRILAIVALVFAFAQPYFPVGKDKQNSSLLPSSVFIDNSFSSENSNSDGNLSNIQKELGYQLLGELPKHINHQLLSNNFEGREQHLFPVTELTKNLEQLDLSSNSQLFSDVVKRQSTAFKTEKFNSYIISDFQKSQFDFDQITNSENNYTLIPVSPQGTQNLSVDSIWFLDPVHRINQEETIHLKVTNHGDEDVNTVQVSLNLDSKNKGQISIAIPAHSSVDTLIKFNSRNSGWHYGNVSIKDYPVVFDNEFFFSFYIKEHINVLEISTNESSNKLETAFSFEPYFSFTKETVNQLHVRKLQLQDLVILNGITEYSSGLIATLVQFTENGGHLAIIPSTEESQASLNLFLRQLQIKPLGALRTDSVRLKDLNQKESLYKGILDEEVPLNATSLPSLHRYWNYPESSLPITHLLSANNQMVLSEWPINTGRVYLFNTANNPEFSDFFFHRLFLPTFYQMAFNSGPNYVSGLKIGENVIITLPQISEKQELIFHVINSDKEVDLIPQVLPTKNNISIALHGGIKQSGIYTVTQNDSTISLLAYNYLRKESHQAFYSQEELKQLIEDLGLTNFEVLDSDISSFSTDFKDNSKGIELWKWFIAFVLLFLLLEIILIRYFKPSVI